MDNYNYPPGADNSSAPWNQHEPDEEEFELQCNQTLSKNMTIFSTNYVEEVDEEYDDGCKCTSVCYNTDDIDWEQEFKDNGYHTPLQLIQLFKQYLEDIRDNTKKANYSSWEINQLITECEGWDEIDTEYEEA